MPIEVFLLSLFVYFSIKSDGVSGVHGMPTKPQETDLKRMVLKLRFVRTHHKLSRSDKIALRK